MQELDYAIMPYLRAGPLSHSILMLETLCPHGIVPIFCLISGWLLNHLTGGPVHGSIDLITRQPMILPSWIVLMAVWNFEFFRGAVLLLPMLANEWQFNFFIDKKNGIPCILKLALPPISSKFTRSILDEACNFLMLFDPLLPKGNYVVFSAGCMRFHGLNQYGSWKFEMLNWISSKGFAGTYWSAVIWSGAFWFWLDLSFGASIKLGKQQNRTDKARTLPDRKNLQLIG